MDFPYRAAISYLTPEKRDAFAKFLANEPEFEVLYTNANGESRTVTRVDYPYGCITKDSRSMEIKGDTRYFTPNASANPDDTEAMVTWRSGNYLDPKVPKSKKEWKRCTGTAWFEWLGKDYKTDAIGPAPIPEAVLREREIQQKRVEMMTRTEEAKKEIARVTKPFPVEDKKIAPKTR